MGTSYTHEKMVQLWSQLEAEGDNEGIVKGRKYKRLDIDNETGFRLSCCFPEKHLELLVGLRSDIAVDDLGLPDWRGMRFELIELEIPVKGSKHLSLRLENREHKDVFAALCSDLADHLAGVTADMREAALAAFLDRWTRFFERYGLRGLSPEKQRGLFGELCWLRILLENNIGYMTALNAWKGCERGYHDFEINGQVVEVKTTITKEPRKVRISNERQLDDRGLRSLHLLVLSLIRSEAGGESLPEIVDELIAVVSVAPGARRRFEQCLNAAGYLDIHASLYTDTYTVKKEELFNVREGFPRIIELPEGVGDIGYSLVVAAANNFFVNRDEYLAIVKGAM